MSYLHLLTEYLLNQFPWWKGSQLRYEPVQKTLYVCCQRLCKQKILLQEVEAIARLEIGVERFIITVPRSVDIVIECQPDGYQLNAGQLVQ
ncbi:MAG: hypothetical protein HC768_21160 [Acaryochloris sp. CRU_2_0]|nr:hypothetical protein [Acaryochloris sp. CRU_2_0]